MPGSLFFLERDSMYLLACLLSSMQPRTSLWNLGIWTDENSYSNSQLPSEFGMRTAGPAIIRIRCGGSVKSPQPLSVSAQERRPAAAAIPQKSIAFSSGEQHFRKLVYNIILNIHMMTHV